MSNDGFATFISDDLPGFNSLNGSGFFQQAGDWNDFSDSSNPVDEGGFDEDCFVVARSTSTDPAKESDVYFFESDDEEDEDVDGSAVEQAVASLKDTSDARRTKSSRRRGDGERPKGERRRPVEGRQRIRRNRTVNDGQEGKSVGSRSSQMRRIKSSDGTTRRMSRPNSKRSENLKKKEVDLGYKLNKLGSMDESSTSQGGRRMRRRASVRELGTDEVSVGSRGVQSCVGAMNESSTSQGGRRMRRRASIRDLGTDEVSVGSRGVQSCAGGCVGRRDARRRRATQSHDLLARNLQQVVQASKLEIRRVSMTTDMPAKGHKEEVWRARRRRSVEAKIPMPIAA